jgi:uncharacterized membrane protein YfcA
VHEVKTEAQGPLAASAQFALSLRSAIGSVLVGIIDGLFSGLTGTGGGAIVVPLLVLNLRVPQRIAHGSSLAIMVLAAIAGAFTYSRAGYTDWRVAFLLALGSLIGVVLGARLMLRVPVLLLRRIFGIFLLFVALRLLLGG